MNLTLHFLRHGQTAQSRGDTFCGSGLDPELTPDGLEMAEAFASAYSSTTWQAIYASALGRAINTARPICEAVQKPMLIRAELNEIAYGQWEGLTKDYVQKTFSEDYENWQDDPVGHTPTGGESAITVAERSLKVIDEVRNNCRNGNVLLVSHKATIRIILCQLLGIDLVGFRYRLDCPVGSASVVEFGPHGPLLKAFANRSHLGDRLRNLPGT
ncbi:MAG TPA: histidine phosphatase family protein [Pyrinomonadaceae bacterium]|nr:histidine phosphatase family protein [Pyrinomonadaceae bacterium]